MKITEVRDGFIKFDADENIYLSAFIQIRDYEKDYVAQVTQLKENSGVIEGYAKILFLLTDLGLQNYDNTLPSVDSEIAEFTSDILCNSIEVTEPVIAGKTLNNELNITIDSSAFNKRMLICVDSDKSNNLIIKNLTKQFKNLGKKIVIIDTLGVIDAHKYVAGIDFKLPLNTDSLAFMYKDCLDEATPDSKSLIVDIFKDLSEYSKTVPFVPFGTLKSIVNDMVDTSHVFKLFVLKTKLNKLGKTGYFADNYNDVKRINEILSKEFAVFDLSNLDAPFQNQYLRYIYSAVTDSDTQVLLELSDSVSKQSLKSIFTNEKISTTFVAHSNYKYINDIKNIFDNFIIEPSSVSNRIFEIYSTFLNSMDDSSYLIAGEATNYIPLASALTNIDDMPLIEKDLSDIDDVSETTVDTSEIIASIDEKSENIIDEVAENLKTPDTLNLFEDENDTEERENESDSFYEKTPIEESIVDEQIAGDTAIEPVEDEQTVINEYDTTSENQEEKNILDELEKEDDEKHYGEDSDVKREAEDGSYVEYETVVTQNISEEPLETTDVVSEEVVSEEVNEEVADEAVEEVPSEFTEETVGEVAEDSITEQPSDDIESAPEAEAETTDTYTIEEQEDAENPIIIDNDIDIDFEDVAENEQNDNLVISEESPATEEVNNELNETFADTEDVIPVSDNDDSELEEIVELDANDVQEDDIIIDMGESLNELSDSAEEQIIKDVDKVFTTRKDDDITDNDLDLIDELNNEEIILEDSEAEDLLDEDNQEDEIIQEQVMDQDDEEDTINSEILEKRDSSTPIVPVYDADIPQEDMVISDPIQQGDSVIHAKYGSGVVEKMIKYGNKTLFAINFDNIGRRLLDPTLTEIKKS